MNIQREFSPVKDEPVIYKGKRCYVDEVQNGIYKILKPSDTFTYVVISEIEPEPRILYANAYCLGFSWEDEKELNKVINDIRKDKDRYLKLIIEVDLVAKDVGYDSESLHSVKNTLINRMIYCDAMIAQATEIISNGQIPYKSYR